MHTPGNKPTTVETKALEQELAKALVALKPFRLNKSWIRVPKKDSEIGIGGFGVVYRAVLQKPLFAPKTQVAVKKFHTIGEWDQLLHVALVLVQELSVWAKLDHPNVLPLIGFHLNSKLEEAWLVSPYAINGNIFEYLERTQLGLDERLGLAKDTAKGLEYLHTRTPPICHGDIKALNILIGVSGHAMLCDFGLAKATDSLQAEAKSKTANDGGTIRYWSPELFDDDSYPTLKSDVWAWGCLLFEIVTGLPPYHDILLEGRLIHVISNKTLPADLDGISCPIHIRDLLGSCWKIDADLRPTMSHVLVSLTAGNIDFYRSESLVPASGGSSTHLDNMERELTEILVPLKQYRVNPSWFEFSKLGSAFGVGGFGVVHRATMRQNWRSRGMVVAVKKLRAMGGRDKRLRMVTALIREVAVWATLSHPNVIQFIGFHLSPRLEEAWLVAPLMANGNLNQYLLLGLKLGTRERLKLALDTAEGLQYLHSLDPPICHGDIKALNVLINANHRAVLCDFGLAKTMESMPSGLTTSTFNQAGSLPYESPELLLGTSLRALESDVWAWGCLLQEIFSGKAPYHWANNAGAIVKFITQDIPPAVLGEIECTSLVRRLLGCCWQSRPATRPSISQCVEVLVDELSGMSDKPGGNALRILQELEQVAYIIVENLLVQRSDLSFSEASNIGSGVFGSVYKGEMAIQPSEPGRVVAIKRLFPSSDETVLPDEVIRAIVTLFARPEHTNILRITSYCADSSSSSSTGELLLVFPFVSTGGLDVYLEHNALTDPKKIALATEIAEALLYLHTRSPPIYHGRLHPRNILISDTGHPLLCDYGFSDFTSRFKQVPATVESLRYQSPEAMNGTSSNTSHNDIWSWGCILLLITLGCIPYEDVKDMGGLMERLERKTYPALLDDIDGDARTINLLGMCWTWDPASRLPMTDVVAILTGRPFKFTRVWSVEVETSRGLRFSRDDKVLAVRGTRSIKMYNVPTGDLLYELGSSDLFRPGAVEHTGTGCMVFSCSGWFFACITGDDILLWDLTTQTIQEHRSTLPDQPYILDISSDDNFCAIGCDDGKVQIWDIKHKEKNRSTRPNPAFDSQCFAIAISPNCEVMATGFLDHGVCVLNVYTLENLAVFNFEWIWSLRFSPDGRYLFAACGDIWKTRCWDMKKIIDGQSESSELHFQEQRSIALSVSGNPTWLISLSYSGGVHAVNLMTESTGSEAQYVGQIPIDSPTRYRVDLSPVSKNGTGYAAALSSNSGELVVCKFASLSHRDAYRF